MYRTKTGDPVTEESAQWFYAKTRWALHWAVPTGEGYGYLPTAKKRSKDAIVAWRPFQYVVKDENAIHPHDILEAVPVNDPLTFDEFIAFAGWTREE